MQQGAFLIIRSSMPLVALLLLVANVAPFPLLNQKVDVSCINYLLLLIFLLILLFTILLLLLILLLIILLLLLLLIIIIIIVVINFIIIIIIILVLSSWPIPRYGLARPATVLTMDDNFSLSIHRPSLLRF